VSLRVAINEARTKANRLIKACWSALVELNQMTQLSM